MTPEDWKQNCFAAVQVRCCGESLEWHSLKTDAERLDFASRLAREPYDELQKLLIEKLEEERSEGLGGNDQADI